MHKVKNINISLPLTTLVLIRSNTLAFYFGKKCGATHQHSFHLCQHPVFVGDDSAIGLISDEVCVC